MSGNLNSIHEHVPEGIRKDNNDLNRLLDVFQGMLKVRKDELDTYVRTFYYPAISDIRIMRRYVDEWSAEYLETSSRLCIDCLYRNYNFIYTSKGTPAGVKRLLQCLFYIDSVPEIGEITYQSGKPLILSDENLFIDFLPNGQDISNEVDAPAGEEVWCPTLLGDSWFDVYTSFAIEIGLNYTPTTEFLDFVKGVLVHYLPMVNEDILNIDINITLI